MRPASQLNLYRNTSRIDTAHPPQTSVKNTSSNGTLNFIVVPPIQISPATAAATTHGPITSPSEYCSRPNAE